METRQYQIIKKVLVVLPFCLFTFLPLSAQTFTQRLQQKGTAGQGTVTITQSDEIDKLVNTENLAPAKAAATTAASPATSTTPPATATTPTTPKPQVNAAVSNPSEEPVQEVDTSKKVMRGGVKVNGYRVQAFAGGNSRKDRQQAEQVGNDIKAHYANVPVYVHFYSPRWICRVGNYRTYEEAHQMLVALRNLGYSQASIVKGKITVQY